MNTPLKILRQSFGYRTFREPQSEIIAHVDDGGDALVLMPTGGGKSLCFQIPAISRHGVGIVFSPLIALMQDQVDALKAKGISAAVINSDVDADTGRLIQHQAMCGELDLLYVAPERLLVADFIAFLDKLYSKAGIALFAIDEAHCISQWGHQFRTTYRKLSVLHKRYPNVPRIALTATADKETQKDIIKQLGLSHAPTFATSFDRPNIKYSVVRSGNQEQQLLRFLDTHKNEAGIVYCRTRDQTEHWAVWLESQGFIALPYHAGLGKEVRKDNLKRFLAEPNVVMIATVAFGMGIDKPDVRFVVHLGLPSDLESYYQETGRAGRDGLSSETWLCIGKSDVVTLRRHVENADVVDARKQAMRDRAEALIQWTGETGCRRVGLLAYFGEKADACGNCDNCLSPEKRTTRRTDTFRNVRTTPRQTQPQMQSPLYDALRRWRDQIAQETRVPSFKIMSEMTLLKLMTQRPRTIEDLLRAEGMSTPLVNRYGPQLLALLKATKALSHT